MLLIFKLKKGIVSPRLSISGLDHWEGIWEMSKWTMTRKPSKDKVQDQREERQKEAEMEDYQERSRGRNCWWEEVPEDRKPLLFPFDEARLLLESRAGQDKTSQKNQEGKNPDHVPCNRMWESGETPGYRSRQNPPKKDNQPTPHNTPPQTNLEITRS